jgi:hypothetical protein
MIAVRTWKIGVWSTAAVVACMIVAKKVAWLSYPDAWFITGIACMPVALISATPFNLKDGELEIGRILKDAFLIWIGTLSVLLLPKGVWVIWFFSVVLVVLLIIYYRDKRKEKNKRIPAK